LSYIEFTFTLALDLFSASHNRKHSSYQKTKHYTEEDEEEVEEEEMPD